MLDILLDTVLDSLKILPFLFLTYIAMEYLEGHASERINEKVKKAGRLGPFWGGLLGAVPQCGFSTAAANLYAGRAISLGTLAAVFLSTSDEMLPIMLSESVALNVVLKFLSLKAIIGVIVGFVIDGILSIRASKTTGQADDGRDFLIERLCEKEHCHCENGSIVLSALKHTGNIIVFVFLITLVLNAAFFFVGEEALIAAIGDRPVAGILLSAVIGLIPNCGASVLLTQMYLHQLIPASHLIAGLLVNAGVGILVLFRVNPDWKENVKITAMLYLISIGIGFFCLWIGLTI